MLLFLVRQIEDAINAETAIKFQFARRTKISEILAMSELNAMSTARTTIMVTETNFKTMISLTIVIDRPPVMYIQ